MTSPHSRLFNMAQLVALSLAVLLTLQGSFSAPSQAASGVPDFDKVIKELQTSIDKSIADAKKSLNLPDDPNGEAIVKAIKEQAAKAEATLKDMKTKLEEQVKNNPQISDALNTLEKKINEARATLKEQNPELAANAQKLTDQLKSAWDSVTGEIDKVHKEFSKKGGAQDDLENILKSLIDRSAAAAKELHNKVQEAVNKNQKKN